MFHLITFVAASSHLDSQQPSPAKRQICFNAIAFLNETKIQKCASLTATEMFLQRNILRANALRTPTVKSKSVTTLMLPIGTHTINDVTFRRRREQNNMVKNNHRLKQSVPIQIYFKNALLDFKMFLLSMFYPRI